jgi:hypothetical protein
MYYLNNSGQVYGDYQNRTHVEISTDLKQFYIGFNFTNKDYGDYNCRVFYQGDYFDDVNLSIGDVNPTTTTRMTTTTTTTTRMTTLTSTISSTTTDNYIKIQAQSLNFRLKYDILNIVIILFPFVIVFILMIEILITIHVLKKCRRNN